MSTTITTQYAPKGKCYGCGRRVERAPYNGGMQVTLPHATLDDGSPLTVRLCWTCLQELGGMWGPRKLFCPTASTPKPPTRAIHVE